MILPPVMAAHIGNFRNAPANGRSLLVVNRKIKIGFHYDSLNHRNEDAAKETLGKIGLLLNERTSSIPSGVLIERFRLCETAESTAGQRLRLRCARSIQYSGTHPTTNASQISTRPAVGFV